jgi:hypothetical protein
LSKDGVNLLIQPIDDRLRVPRGAKTLPKE